MASVIPHAAASQNASRISSAAQDTETHSISILSHAAERQPQVTAVPQDLLRQILGLNPFKTSYFALYRPLQDTCFRSILATGTLLAVAAGVPLPVIAVIFGKLIDSFPPSEGELRLRVGQLLGVAAAYLTVTWAWAICFSIVGEKVSRELRERTVERVLGMDQLFFDVECSDITRQLTTDTEAIQLGTSEKAGIFLQSVSYFTATFVVGFILNARLTGILFATIIPAMILIVCAGTKLVSRCSRNASKWSEAATERAEEAVKAVQDVQALDATKQLADEHRQLLQNAGRDGIQRNLWAALMLGCIFFFAYGANALAFGIGSKMIASGSTGGGAGTIYAIVMLVVDASCVIGQFGPYLKTFATAAAAGRNIFAILDRPEAHIDVYSQEGIVAEPDQMAAVIKFESVTFVYPARPAVRVLESFSTTFEAGSITGICGSNGSGKSTIVAQLVRLYDPSSGRITIGGQDIRDFTVESLRAHVSVVSQEATLFSATSILNNIAYGLKRSGDITPTEKEACVNAAKAANAWQFITDLPNGINTIIGQEGGTSLSGGQAQKVCLARALVSNPPILILDEFTSALDSVSETSILQALAADSRRTTRTTIVIAHRLATIKNAHKILVMDNGLVCESGTHESLMAKSMGVYRSLVEAQNLNTGQDPEIFSETANEILIEATGNRLSHTDGTEVTQEERKRTRSVVARCLELSRRDFPLIYVGLFASVLTGGIIIGEAVVFGNLVAILNSDLLPGPLVSEASKYCLIFLALALCALAAYTGSGFCFGVVSEHLNLVTRDISLRNILRQDPEWFSKPGNSVHALMATMTTDSGHLSGLSGIIVGTILCALTSLFGGIILAHIVAWKIAIVLLGALPIVLLAGYMRLKVLAHFEHQHKTAYNAAAAIASEACSKISTVAALGRQKGVLQQYKEAIQGPYEEGIRNSVVGNLMLAFSLSITYFIYALAYWWGAKLVRNGEYSTLDFFVVLPALLFSAQSCGQMFSLAPEITRAVQAATNVFSLHDQTPTIAHDEPVDTSQVTLDKVHDLEKSPSSPPPDHQPNIELNMISVTYSSRPLSPALQLSSLSILPLAFTAFVGPSGSGKSTIVSLLARFIDPTSGSVYFDGEDIRSLPASRHRHRLGVVLQNPNLLSGSIKSNVLLGIDDEKRRDFDVVDICEKVGLHDFVMGLPEGYETDVGRNNGERLSGGQKQRLALARTLIRSPTILLLDEATSQMDAHSEKQIFDLIRGRRDTAGRRSTAIVVAHRLANVQYADRIHVFDKGQIIETGTHDELLQLRGLYAAMVEKQKLGV